MAEYEGGIKEDTFNMTSPDSRLFSYFLGHISPCLDCGLYEDVQTERRKDITHQ